MNQLSLFDTPPAAHPRAARPDLPLLILASADHIIGAAPAAPTFTKQATPEQARNLLADLNATTAAAFCLSRFTEYQCAVRAIEIAITGGHSLALTGYPDLLAACAWQVPGYLESGAYINHPAMAENRQFAMQLAMADDWGSNEESTAIIAARIEESRARIAAAALADNPGPLQMDEKAAHLMNQAQEAMGFNDHQRAAILSVAHTIAHMAACQYIGRIHVAEALSYRERVRT